jgi:Tol biopolymer transport system component
VQTLYGSDKSLGWATTWSKDGQWIAFTTGQIFGGVRGICDIQKMRPDGSGLINLTMDSQANNAFPDFSPDSRRIVFRSSRDGNQEIYLMDADGGNLHRLTENQATDTMPTFSPSGNQIAFASNRDDDYEIYTLDIAADGTAKELRRLTNSPRRDTHPHYSPDGKWIIFASERGGFTDELPLVNEVIFNPQPFGEIYAMRLADSKVFRLTHNKWEDGLAVWRPTKKSTMEAAGLK